MQIQFDKTSVKDFSELVDRYPMGELKKPTRSTVPLLSFWRDVDARYAWLLRNWNHALGQGAKACFEFTVPSASRNNRPSQTDLMFIGEALAVAVEGKWTEPHYRMVRDWLNDSKYSNKNAVLEHWLGLISRKTGRSLSTSSVEGVVYQTLHRTASACSLPAAAVHVVYHGFGLDAEKAEYYAANLNSLNSLLGKPANLRFYLLTTPLTKTQIFESLTNEVKQLCRANKEAAEQIVREKLKQGGLFEFGDSNLLAID